MREIIWTDGEGKKQVALVRDSDPDKMAKFGIPKMPPDISLLDWKRMERELHNALIDRGLFTWKDVQVNQGALTGAIISVIRKKLVSLYKQREQEVK